jgi:magnesium-transporting ATPase (P-type)
MEGEPCTAAGLVAYLCCDAHCHVVLAVQTDQRTGLSESQVVERRAQYGFNELAENKRHPRLIFLSYFWGPMPCMIWACINCTE